jgi:proline-specific peptidase
MSDMAKNNMRVVFYDQLGCGQSDKTEDPRLWTVEHFVEEIETVRTSLNLGKVDLWGHSCGGIWAQEYALAYPNSLRTVCLANTTASLPLHRRELAKLIDDSPPNDARLLRIAFEGGETEGPEYSAASERFIQRHLLRVPATPEIQAAGDNTATAIFEHMWGPDDVALRGTLATWDASARIGEITTPTLVAAGAHDVFTPAEARALAEGIADSDLIVFGNSSHHPFWEERERYMTTIGGFLAKH